MAFFFRMESAFMAVCCPFPCCIRPTRTKRERAAAGKRVGPLFAELIQAVEGLSLEDAVVDYEVIAVVGSGAEMSAHGVADGNRGVRPCDVRTCIVPALQWFPVIVEVTELSEMPYVR